MAEKDLLVVVPSGHKLVELLQAARGNTTCRAAVALVDEACVAACWPA